MMYRKVLKTLSMKNYNNISRFCSSNVKPLRRQIVSMENISEIIESEKENCTNWASFTESILQKINNKKFNQNNIDNTILSHCLSTKNFNVVEKYLDYLDKTKIKPNLATEGKILLLLSLKNRLNCLEKDEKIIFNRYDNLRKHYPILDCITLENCVAALSVTTRWRECLTLLEEIKISTHVSSKPYSFLVSAAFKNNDYNLGFEILERMFNEEQKPLDIIFDSYLNNVNKTSGKNEFLNKIERLLCYLKEKEMICSLETIESLWRSCSNKKIHSSFVSIPFKGFCTNCKQKLNKFELSDSEFNELKSTILKNVIIGKDMFIKTNPDELEKFKKFINEINKFDVVLDGLNVAYSTGSNKGKKLYAEIVSAVVSYFYNQGKSVLLLGRVHMQRWPAHIWNNITKQSTVFLTQNISQDDPYLLYCAISSGKDTIIVTRDLMRGHKFLLNDPKLKMLFDRWLVQRQYHLLRVDLNSKVPIFRAPPPFTPIPQKIGDFWHIPHKTENELDNNNYQKTWLCIKTKT